MHIRLTPDNAAIVQEIATKEDRHVAKVANRLVRESPEVKRFLASRAKTKKPVSA